MDDDGSLRWIYNKWTLCTSKCYCLRVVYAGLREHGRSDRPNKKDKWIKQAFGDQPFKRLEIPDFINMYNHLMNGVD